MTRVEIERLSRRESQIMDIVYERGEVSAADILMALDDAPSYSAVRAFLKILETKGQLVHREVAGKYLYSPAQSWTSVAKQSIERVVDRFFEGSLEKAVATLLSSDSRPTAEELARIETIFQAARMEDAKE